MDRIPVNPGMVDWSGENPVMYLKESADGPFVTLISFFRVVLSPHGRGHAAFLFLDPMAMGRHPVDRTSASRTTSLWPAISRTTSLPFSQPSRGSWPCRTV